MILPDFAGKVKLSFKLMQWTILQSHTNGCPDLLQFIICQQMTVSCDLERLLNLNKCKGVEYSNNIEQLPESIHHPLFHIAGIDWSRILQSTDDVISWSTSLWSNSCLLRQYSQDEWWHLEKLFVKAGTDWEAAPTDKTTLLDTLCMWCKSLMQFKGDIQHLSTAL